MQEATQNETIVRHQGREFSYDSAVALFQFARQLDGGQSLVLDLSQSFSTSTAAMAKLVELRKLLLSTGSDLRVTGLSGMVDAIFNIHRLSNILPC